LLYLARSVEVYVYTFHGYFSTYVSVIQMTREKLYTITRNIFFKAMESKKSGKLYRSNERSAGKQSYRFVINRIHQTHGLYYPLPGQESRILRRQRF